MLVFGGVNHQQITTNQELVEMFEKLFLQTSAVKMTNISTLRASVPPKTSRHMRHIQPVSTKQVRNTTRQVGILRLQLTWTKQLTTHGMLARHRTLNIVDVMWQALGGSSNQKLILSAVY